MITYLYGTDKYRIKEYLREHVPNAQVGEETLKMQGLFGSSPVVLYDPPENLEIPEDIDVYIVSENKIKKGVEFGPLRGAEIKKWLDDEIKKAGYQITSDALQLLCARYIDSWQMVCELEKIYCFTRKSKKITHDVVNTLSNPISQENIFQLTDAMANRQKGSAVMLLSRHLASGADPFYLFAMILMQFRNMLAPKRTGIHPFAAQKAISAAKKYSFENLKSLYKKLYLLEKNAKNGVVDIEDGLFGFILSL